MATPAVNLSLANATAANSTAALHRGHEVAHARMALILMAALVGSQIGVAVWRRSHPRSFHAASLAGLALVPPGIGLNAGNYRFVLIWLLFAVASAVVVRPALKSPIDTATPRRVYRWYAGVYNVCYVVGALGYIISLIALFHVPAVFRIVSIQSEPKIFQTGLLLLFYGLYFGTLGRDCVVALSDHMAASIGYYSKSGFPRKHLREHMCAICGTSTTKSYDEPLHTLNCGHTYHEECIRGWTIIGKKDICPYCKEKVDLNAFKKNPWDTSQQLYLSLLDTLRYILVWNPLVFIVVHIIFKIFNLH